MHICVIVYVHSYVVIITIILELPLHNRNAQGMTRRSLLLSKIIVQAEFQGKSGEKPQRESKKGNESMKSFLVEI